QGNTGTYRILFPFFWYAYNAEMAFPLFPARPQTFAAFWPLIGDFRGYYNRDRIFFFLWPLIVYSNHGRGEDFIETSSFIWPIFARHGGHNVSGFRIWPLFSTVRKKDEFTRSYFIWPLGHYRSGRISRQDAREQNVFMFLPFYARIRRPDFNFDMVFPFFGSLEVGQREVDGYFLAIYNVERNYRRNTRENRILWFIWRWRKPLDGIEPEEFDDTIATGGGLFPIYTNVEGSRSRRQTIIWPIYHDRWNKYEEYEFSRRYVVPFYSSQQWDYDDGPTRKRRFFFPFFRQTQTLEGIKRENSLHLWFHTEVEPVDRLYAPIWEFWNRQENLETGEKSVHWFQTAHRFERHKDGTERRRTNLLFFDRETMRDQDGELHRGSTRLFWGLAGHHTTPEDGRQVEFLWMRF
ncbi:MAG: hypothetical protein JJU11_07875, partial [Candidatus Sumerlaeia bacterium]|nr:hypothetical protein [Candidatus Sumerlaeia bacterium]